jgi:hypothetical protein
MACTRHLYYAIVFDKCNSPKQKFFLLPVFFAKISLARKNTGICGQSLSLPECRILPLTTIQAAPLSDYCQLFRHNVGATTGWWLPSLDGGVLPFFAADCYNLSGAAGAAYMQTSLNMIPYSIFPDQASRWTRRFFVAAIIASCFAAAGLAAGPEAAGRGQTNRPAEAGDFIRLRRDARKQPLSLETAIVRYHPRGKTESDGFVDLIAAFHIGDKSYYEALNKAFEDYDVVLYELVAPLGTRVPKGGGKSDSAVSKVQKFLKDSLELEFQLDHIDYTKANFVHADMSPADMAKSMSDNGETWLKILGRMMSYSATQQSKRSSDESGVELLAAFFSKDRATALKRAFAEQLEDNDSLAALEQISPTLVAGRNKVVLEALRKQMAAGKKKIAIFYGGGHMPDLDSHLRTDFGLVPGETRWLAAWNLESKAPAKQKAQAEATETKPPPGTAPTPEPVKADH